MSTMSLSDGREEAVSAWGIKRGEKPITHDVVFFAALRHKIVCVLEGFKWITLWMGCELPGEPRLPWRSNAVVTWRQAGAPLDFGYPLANGGMA